MTSPKLSTEEQAIYDLIAGNDRITQLQISKHEKYLGIHPLHEAHLNVDKQQSTLRKIRQIVRTMRIDKGVMILSDRDGYYLLQTPEQAKEFVERLERTAKAQAKSWMVTYHAIRKGLGITSDYFEKEQSNKVKVKAHTRSIKKDVPIKTIQQDKLFD